ncbi:MAG: hypothetical protein COA80_13900 [Leeuwenhoekiella sp.]|uniref:Uncharacterized protein n=2 Tax=Leeuwenhoekiella nanhaiensis TaxID=1655491 RepID=A0A2G1VVU7_9FLAO|nr:hypothetical protein CJ305_01365 [Leeuwenhoekiella nanhaiensis]PHR93061.1 MAG: hypothetical protein COA80_13900 [Leeuwenhoekiella sp.]
MGEIPLTPTELYPYICVKALGMNNALCIRLTLLFIALNSIAFMVNCCGISPRFDFQKNHSCFEFFLLTDTSKESPALSKVGQREQELDGFWPFENFYVEIPAEDAPATRRFRGLFAGFETGEFIFYSILIAAVFLFLKLW